MWWGDRSLCISAVIFTAVLTLPIPIYEFVTSSAALDDGVPIAFEEACHLGTLLPITWYFVDQTIFLVTSVLLCVTIACIPLVLERSRGYPPQTTLLRLVYDYSPICSVIVFLLMAFCVLWCCLVGSMLFWSSACSNEISTSSSSSDMAKLWRLFIVVFAHRLLVFLVIPVLLITCC
jgi:hypothetical protein